MRNKIEPTCEFCLSVLMVRNGLSSSRRQRWKCLKCDRTGGRPGRLVGQARSYQHIGFSNDNIAKFLDVTVETVNGWVGEPEKV